MTIASPMPAPPLAPTLLAKTKGAHGDGANSSGATFPSSSSGASGLAQRGTSQLAGKSCDSGYIDSTEGVVKSEIARKTTVADEEDEDADEELVVEEKETTVHAKGRSASTANAKEAEFGPCTPITDFNVQRALAERWTAVAPKTKASACVKMTPSNLYEEYAFKILRDHRDLPVLNFAIQATLTVIPSGINLLVGFHRAWWLYILHAALVIKQIETYVLALHVSSHRKLFKPEYNILNYWLPGLLAPFMGHTWGTYYWHHVKMHHVTDNGPDDLSTTLFYQRDNLLHFVQYFLDFFFLSWFKLALYFYRQNRPLVSLAVVAGEAAWLSFVTLYRLAYPSASWWSLAVTIVIPFVGMRFGMMQGNWVQHAFIERTDPLGGGMKNSITVIDCEYNKRCFNDGYHASHHVNAIRHWTEHPTELVRHRQNYYDDGAIVFAGVNYGEIWTMLMKKDYKAIAERWVHMGTEEQRPKSLAEVENLLREKTRRFENAQAIEKIYAKSS